jgi:hypothetical protein
LAPAPHDISNESRISWSAWPGWQTFDAVHCKGKLDKVVDQTTTLLILTVKHFPEGIDNEKIVQVIAKKS